MANSGAAPDVRRALIATHVSFAGLGVAGASWAARIPQVKAQLGLGTSQLGLVLLALAGGSLIALPGAGPLVMRLGSRRALRAASVLAGIGLLIVAIGSREQAPVLATGLLVFGMAGGVWDVAINVQGALVERRAGRSVMSRFHAFFSVGTVAGALAGAGMIAGHVSVTADLVAVAAIVPASAWFATRHYLGDREHVDAEEHRAARRHNPWRERRTLLIGILVLAFALAEGSGNDWISVSLTDGRHAAPVVGTLGYGTFVAALTAVRWHGPGLLERFGRTAVLRLLAGVAVLGLLSFTFAPSTGVAFAGVILWGAGASLGFPVGMSAGADDPALAAPRVGTITSIGYLAFLGGPPLIGLVATGLGLPHALWVVIAPLLAATAIAAAAAPQARAR